MANLRSLLVGGIRKLLSTIPKTALIATLREDCCCAVDCCVQASTLTATFSGTGSCSAIGGTMTLTESAPGIYTGNKSGCGNFTLSCTGESDTGCSTSWVMSVSGCPSNPNQNGTLVVDSCVCDPIYLEFVFTVPINDLACGSCCSAFVAGTYTITITN